MTATEITEERQETCQSEENLEALVSNEINRDENKINEEFGDYQS